MRPREREIIHELLAERGISHYELLWTAHEGKDLPGGSYPGEIECLSGTVVTPSHVYSFWLDWVDGKYTLDENWREVPVEEFVSEYSRYEVREVQERLKSQVREREGS